MGEDNWSWWPSGLEFVSNSSRHSLEDPGLNPTLGVFIPTNLNISKNFDFLKFIMAIMAIFC